MTTLTRHARSTAQAVLRSWIDAGGYTRIVVAALFVNWGALYVVQQASPTVPLNGPRALQATTEVLGFLGIAVALAWVLGFLPLIRRGATADVWARHVLTGTAIVVVLYTVLAANGQILSALFGL